jgi:hypothetical protein
MVQTNISGLGLPVHCYVLILSYQYKAFLPLESSFLYDDIGILTVEMYQSCLHGQIKRSVI